MQGDEARTRFRHLPDEVEADGFVGARRYDTPIGGPGNAARDPAPHGAHRRDGGHPRRGRRVRRGPRPAGHFHGHTAAALPTDPGADARTVQENLGHFQIGRTGRYIRASGALASGGIDRRGSALLDDAQRRVEPRGSRPESRPTGLLPC